MADIASQIRNFCRSNTDLEVLDILSHMDPSFSEQVSLHENAAAIREMLTAKASAKSLKIANGLLNDKKSELGIPHVVLARQSSSPEQENQYRLAHQESQNHLFQHGTDGNFKADKLHAAITLEMADALWNSDQHESAIELLRNLHLKSEELWMGESNREFTTALLTTFLICEGRDDEAREVLDKDQIPTLEWFFLNALLHFRKLGDCAISRSALSIALEESILVASILTETEAESEVLDDAETDWEDHYALITKQAWQKNPEALLWLSHRQDVTPSLFGAEEHLDEVKYKRWQREFEMIDTHVRREDFKGMKKSFKTALREAENLNDGGATYLFTAQMFGAFLIELDEPLGELPAGISKKIAWLDRQESQDFESLFSSFSECVEVSMNLSMLDAAQHCAEKAISLLEKSIAQGSEKLTTDDGIPCRTYLAVLLSQQKKYSEAVEEFSKLVRIQEEYLGKNHLSLVDGLKGWRFCLHQLGRHDEEKVVYDRLEAIDANFDADDDEYKYECNPALVTS